ncbi:MAG TPA: CBS domain-containing protein [Spirochaetales bacterium]|nr:CBS domain-containing protein [Spirochaetales bacterium]HOV38204.1 CBS domain-containing protein [Spirochaetales bacterium]
MFIKYVMTHNPITITPDTTVTDAQAIMRREKIHHLPVLDKHNKLIGLVTEKDLLYASPSPATTLSVFEMSALLSKLKVEKVMSKHVIAIQENTLIEDAAHTMADNDIGGLPVLRDDVLVGIVTESDIFRLFIELFGTRKKGVRITALISEEPGQLARVTAAIAEKGGNIISIGTFPGEDVTTGYLLLKVEGVPQKELQNSIRPLVKELIDVREV